MRRILLAAAITIATATLASAQANERVITVSGSATVFVKPDVVRVHYGVKVTEPSADAVKDVLGKTGAAMDEAVKKLKLTNVKVTSAPVALKQGSSNPNGQAAFAPPGGGAPAAPMPGIGPFTGVSSHTATITDSDPEKLKTAVDAFVKAIVEGGANTSGGDDKEQNLEFVFPGREMSSGPKIVLSRSDDSAGRDEALQKAVEKAVRNAKAIAKGLGATEVKVISVTDEAEKTSEAQSPFASIYGGESPNAHRTNAGEVEVKVRVIVKCSY
jgi:uncharacterized protein YggE